ncbi:MAG: hypothetical protein E7447_05880 [Ruminococcaceae bacterium]|nr:hypothetical protein [Oscillospiraceae bacterium]
MHGTYEFRKELLQIHRPNTLDEAYIPKAGEICIADWTIVIAKNCDRVLYTGAQDLQDYLLTSLSSSVTIRRKSELAELPSKTILVATCEQMGVQWQGEKIPASYRITVGDDFVIVCGIDERGCAQGCYQLEDRMNRIHAPYLAKGVTTYSPEFSPRMVHSGYQLDRYPDAHLSAIAHAGMDAILMFVDGVNQTPSGYMDFNELIYRAGKYGLDVYAYSYFYTKLHPDDPGSPAEFEATYGALFRECPGLKGVVLVGESVEFPSKDPRASKGTQSTNKTDGIPNPKPTAGWIPCLDYPQWLERLKSAVRKYKNDADIVFWTYNWGYCSEKERLELIDCLPTDISLMATFEMFEEKVVDGVRHRACDYTISFPESGAYFVSEAKRAKERGIRLYAQANSGGMTWDFGTVPYQPVPYHWKRRYDAMLEAKDKYGLCGIMESHHFGFWPSFISKLEKKMFTYPRTPGDEAVRQVAVELYGEKFADKAVAAWQKLSEGYAYYICTNEDQYGPFRVGPAYPLVYNQDVQIPTVPYAHFGGNMICVTDYACGKVFFYISFGQMRTAKTQQRHPEEAKCLEKLEAKFGQARAMLEEIAQELTGWQKEECLRLCNMIHYMEHTTRTTINVKRWNVLRHKCFAETDSTKLLQLHQQMIQLGEEEIQNAEATIPLVQADSRLGWEPTMEYIGSEYHLRWKIRQVRQVLDYEIPRGTWDIQYILDKDGKY